MKALYIPTVILVAILGFSLWAGRYVELCTDHWIALLEETDDAAMDGNWQEAEQRLERAYADWDSSQAFFHTIMEHDELDEAESLFAGAFSVCRQQDGSDFHLLMAQLMTQLRMLSEMQGVSIQNVL